MINNTVISYSGCLLPALQRECHLNEPISIRHDEPLSEGIARNLLHRQIAGQLNKDLASTSSNYYIESHGQMDEEKVQADVHNVIYVHAKRFAEQYGQTLLTRRSEYHSYLLTHCLMAPIARCIPCLPSIIGKFMNQDRTGVGNLEGHKTVQLCTDQAFRDLGSTLPRNNAAKYKWTRQLRPYSHSAWLAG